MKKLVLCSAVSLAIGIAIGFSWGHRDEPPPPTREQMMTFLETLDAHEIDRLKRSLQSRWGVRPSTPSSEPAR